MKNPKLFKRILAWIAIILLIGLYVATFILALCKNPSAQALFRASLASTVIIPIFCYVILLIHRILNKKDL